MFIISGCHSDDLFEGFGEVAAALEAAQAGDLSHGKTPLGQQPQAFADPAGDHIFVGTLVKDPSEQAAAFTLAQGTDRCKLRQGDGTAAVLLDVGHGGFHTGNIPDRTTGGGALGTGMFTEQPPDLCDSLQKRKLQKRRLLKILVCHGNCGVDQFSLPGGTAVQEDTGTRCVREKGSNITLIDQASRRTEQKADIAENCLIETAVAIILHVCMKNIGIKKNTGAFRQTVGGPVSLADDTALCHKGHLQLRVPVKGNLAAKKVLNIFMLNVEGEAAVNRFVQLPLFFIRKNNTFLHTMLPDNPII